MTEHQRLPMANSNNSSTTSQGSSSSRSNLSVASPPLRLPRPPRHLSEGKRSVVGLLPPQQQQQQRLPTQYRRLDFGTNGSEASRPGLSPPPPAVVVAAAVASALTWPPSGATQTHRLHRRLRSLVDRQRCSTGRPRKTC